MKNSQNIGVDLSRANSHDAVIHITDILDGFLLGLREDVLLAQEVTDSFTVRYLSDTRSTGLVQPRVASFVRIETGSILPAFFLTQFKGISPIVRYSEYEYIIKLESLVAAIRFSLASLEMLIDFDSKILSFSIESQSSLMVAMAHWPIASFVSFAKYHTAWPICRYLSHKDIDGNEMNILPVKPENFPSHPLIWTGPMRRFLKNRLISKSEKNLTLFWSLLQGVKRGAAEVPDTYINASKFKHMKTMHKAPTRDLNAITESYGEFLERFYHPLSNYKGKDRTNLSSNELDLLGESVQEKRQFALSKKSEAAQITRMNERDEFFTSISNIENQNELLDEWLDNQNDIDEAAKCKREMEKHDLNDLCSMIRLYEGSQSACIELSRAKGGQREVIREYAMGIELGTLRNFDTGVSNPIIKLFEKKNVWSQEVPEDVDLFEEFDRRFKLSPIEGREKVASKRKGRWFKDVKTVANAHYCEEDQLIIDEALTIFNNSILEDEDQELTREEHWLFAIVEVTERHSRMGFNTRSLVGYPLISMSSKKSNYGGEMPKLSDILRKVKEMYHSYVVRGEEGGEMGVDVKFEEFERDGFVTYSVVEAILEKLKVRLITKGEVFPLYIGKFFQRYLWEKNFNYPCFNPTGAVVTTCTIRDLLERQSVLETRMAEVGLDEKFDLWLSGDYAGATDELNKNFSELALETSLKDAKLPPYVKNALRSQIYPQHIVYHDEDGELLKYLTSLGVKFDKETDMNAEFGIEKTEFKGKSCFIVKQENGQLMGSILSFPLLCAANLVCYWKCLEEYTGLKFTVSELPVLINGDDILFRSNESFYKLWLKEIKNIGFTLSIGKNYIHPHIFTINSILHTYHVHPSSNSRSVLKADPCTLKRVNYFNCGILLSGQDDTKNGRLKPIWDCYNEFISGTENPWQSHKRFLHHNKTIIQHITNKGKFNLFFAHELGGLGFKLHPDVKKGIETEQCFSISTKFQRQYAKACRDLYGTEDRLIRTGQKPTLQHKMISTETKLPYHIDKPPFILIKSVPKIGPLNQFHVPIENPEKPMFFDNKSQFEELKFDLIPRKKLDKFFKSLPTGNMPELAERFCFEYHYRYIRVLPQTIALPLLNHTYPEIDLL